jgi:hypothetical protein
MLLNSETLYDFTFLKGGLKLLYLMSKNIKVATVTINENKSA